MIKKTITYLDMTGTEITEAFYFHMFPHEATRLQWKYGVSLENHVNNIQENKDGKQAIQLVEDIILGSYGKRSDDNKSFMKPPELTKAFEYSVAYANLFEELILNPKKLEEFAIGIGLLEKKEEQNRQTSFSDLNK